MSHSAYFMHAMESRMGGGFKARTVISPSHGIHLAAVALAYVTGILAMNFLAVDVLRMLCSIA
jgi:hypothetical protein